MVAPSFLNTDFQKVVLSGVTDWSSVITAIGTLLTSTLSSTSSGNFPTTQQWTSLGGGAYKSPLDAKGRYMTITFTRNSATSLEFVVSDLTGQVYDGRVTLASGNTVTIMAGPGHFYMEAFDGSFFETCRAFISDPTPETLDTATSYVWCWSFRDNAGNPQTNNSDNWFGRTADGVLFANIFAILARPYAQISDSTSTRLLTEAGSDVAAPAAIGVHSNAIGQNGSNFGAGKMYQLICVDANMSAGAVLGTVPVDTGITGKFQVLQVPSSGSCRLAVRIP